jgi:hypothetical protein
MFATLAPLHAMIEKGPETPNESYFHQTFGHELAAAWDTLRVKLLLLSVFFFVCVCSMCSNTCNPSVIYCYIYFFSGKERGVWSEWRQRYHRTLKMPDLNKGWDIYHQIFKKIRHLPAVSSYELRQVRLAFLSTCTCISLSLSLCMCLMLARR